MSDAAVSTGLLEEANRAMELLGEATNLLFYIYDGDVLYVEELHDASAGKELAQQVYFVPFHLPYKVRCQGELESSSLDVFGA